MGDFSLMREIKCPKKRSCLPFLAKFCCQKKTHIALRARVLTSVTSWYLPASVLTLHTCWCAAPEHARQAPTSGLQGSCGPGLDSEDGEDRDKLAGQAAPLHLVYEGPMPAIPQQCPYFVLSSHQSFSQAFSGAGVFSFCHDYFVMCLEPTGI